jgi:hypothetical protein
MHHLADFLAREAAFISGIPPWGWALLLCLLIWLGITSMFQPPR